MLYEVITWLAYNGYFTRSAVKVGRRAKGGWEPDKQAKAEQAADNPERRHLGWKRLLVQGIV